MKIKIFKHLLLMLSFSLPFTVNAGSYDNVYVFGDSLSDNGNLATLSLVSPKASQYKFLNFPPYQQGFTNGPTAVVRLAQMLGAPELKPSLYFSGNISGGNFAVAGARSAGTIDSADIDLNTQVNAHLFSQQGNASSTALYILFIGGNDIRDMRDKTNLKDVLSILALAKQNIQNNLALLIASGARHVMVVNSPNIGALPETKALAATRPNLVLRTTLLTQTFNAALADVVGKVEKTSGVDIVLFDVFTLFNNLVKDNKAFAFTNAKDACFSSVALVYYPVCSESQIDQFVFLDEIHPTRRIQERVARAMFAVAPE